MMSVESIRLRTSNSDNYDELSGSRNVGNFLNNCASFQLSGRTAVQDVTHLLVQLERYK